MKPFPDRRSLHGRQGRDTVRFTARPPQPRPEPDINTRIAWAKATASNYEEWSEKPHIGEPMRKALRDLAMKWNRTVEALIEERKARGVQPELLFA